MRGLWAAGVGAGGEAGEEADAVAVGAAAAAYDVEEGFGEQGADFADKLVSGFVCSRGSGVGVVDCGKRRYCGEFAKGGDRRVAVKSQCVNAVGPNYLQHVGEGMAGVKAARLV